MIFPSKSKPWIILPLRLVRSVAANYASNRSKWKVKTIIADGRNLFLNTLTWFLKFFARLSLLFWGRRKFFLIRKSRASVSNDSELLEFIVPRLRISLFDNCSFSFPLERKKVFGEILKKIVTIQRYPPFFHLFLSLSWKNFLMKIVIERSYIFSSFKLLENRIEYFSFPKVHFFKIAKTFRRRQN